MSYNMMSDYINMSRVEEFHKEKAKSLKTNTGVLTRNPDERDFSSVWGQGVIMNWAYVPKEDQKTHINWRQSINDDGQNMKRLASWPCSETNQAPNIVDNKQTSGAMTKNKDAMDNYKYPGVGPNLHPFIESGKNIVNEKDVAANEFRGGEMNSVKEACKGTDADPLTIACISYILKTRDYVALVQRYQECEKAIGTKNVALIICAMATSPETIIGGNGCVRLDQVKITQIEGNGEGSTLAPLVWADKENWTWVEFAPYWLTQVDSNSQVADLYPKICYLYNAIKPMCSNSRFDEDDFGFPFFDEQFKNGDEIRYSSPYGPRDPSVGAGDFHYGIDLGADEGVEIHAVANGTVKEDGNGDAWGPWHGICIQHDDGQTYSRYLHCSTMNVAVGQHVNRGDVIGTVGHAGGNYSPHLHLEVSPGDAVSGHSPNDPLTYFPKFQSTVSLGQFLSTTPITSETQSNQG